jgi:putative membrane protein insertion efficiency factor
MANLLGTLMRGFIGAYQLVLSPVLGPRCRHLPTCSEYASEAIELHGPLRGGWLAARRVLSCHPWGSSGYDPVPGSVSGTTDGDAGKDASARAPGKVS